MNRFRNLEIWQRSVNLATDIYKVTKRFPVEERYGLVSQLRRCVVSMSSNISEGAGRSSSKDFRRFLSYAYASSYELETQLTISMNLNMISKDKYKELSVEINEIQKMIYTFLNKLKG